MATSLNTRQIRDGNVKEEDVSSGAITRDKLNVQSVGKAVVRKVIFDATQFNATSNGADAGTGDISVAAKPDYIIALSKSYKYYAKAILSTPYALVGNTWEVVNFDMIDFLWDDNQGRYNNTSMSLLMHPNELWMFNISVMVQPNNTAPAVGPWSILLEDTVSKKVIASVSSAGLGDSEVLQINTTHIITSGTAQMRVSVYATEKLDVLSLSRFGESYATQFNMNRLR